jgi:hypothetical protein
VLDGEDNDDDEEEDVWSGPREFPHEEILNTKNSVQLAATTRGSILIIDFFHGNNRRLIIINVLFLLFREIAALRMGGLITQTSGNYQRL